MLQPAEPEAILVLMWPGPKVIWVLHNAGPNIVIYNINNNI
jgi:hypothetical protein